MTNLLLSFREWWRPARKCKRIGHSYQEKRKLIRRASWDYGVVAADYEATIDYCKRCGHHSGPPRDEHQIDAWSSVSMPIDMDRTMRKAGYVVIGDA